MGPLDDPMADDFFIPNPPLLLYYICVAFLCLIYDLFENSCPKCIPNE